MLKIIRNNTSFFIGALLFFILGIVLFFSIDKGDAILFFSERRTPFLDTFFIYWTKLGEEYFYIIGLIAFLFIRFRYAILIPITGICVVLVSGISKAYFAHNRPKIWFMNMDRLEEINFVEGINVLIGATSFPSGHAMSAFALYSLIAFFLPNKKIAGVLFFVIALLIAVSRVYLVHHFFQDVFIGSTTGLLLAMTIYVVQSRYPVKEGHWLDEPFFSLKRKKAVA